MQTSNRKGQMLSPDFVLGLVIFSIVLIIGFTLWDVSYRRSVWFYDIELMQDKALYASSKLLNTPGVPQDWDTTNVVMVGLKDNESLALDADKILNFRRLGYNNSRELLGIGSFDYYINVTDSSGKQLKIDGVVHGIAAVFASQGGDNVIKDLLQNYDEGWDYYWASGGVVPPNSARYVYQDSNADDLFDALRDNLSSYDTVIVEGANSVSLDAADDTALQNFVYNGGTLIDIQDEDDAEIINHFPNVPDGEATVASDIDGTVVNDDILLPGRDIGDNFTFQTRKYRFDVGNVDKTIVESRGNPGKCLVCSWNYGGGHVYYLPDGSEDSGEPIDGMDMDGIELIFGDNSTASADNVAQVKRLVIVMNGDEVKTGLMRFYVYK